VYIDWLKQPLWDLNGHMEFGKGWPRGHVSAALAWLTDTRRRRHLFLRYSEAAAYWLLEKRMFQ
jgi:hypothetical protein